MTNLEREELATRTRALSAEERELVIDNLPTEELIAGVHRAYANMSEKYENIKTLMKNI